jgi:hypothetical protein
MSKFQRIFENRRIMNESECKSMAKKSFDRIKKTISILLAVLFLISITAATVNAEEATGIAPDTNTHDSGITPYDSGTLTDAGTASSAAATSIDSSSS